MKNNSVTVEGIHYKENRGIQITINGGIIEAIKPYEVKEPTTFIAPGFVDLQVNGFKGVDFNNLTLSETDIEKAVCFLLEEGVTSFYPTVITNSYENITKLVQIIYEAVKKNEVIRQAIPGIHLEGPFLSPENGPRGAHSIHAIQPPNWNFFKQLNDTVNGFIKIITLSPEWKEAADFINKGVNSGVLVSIGHTNATSEQIRKAVQAGAKLSTHLGNGAHVLLPRHPNYLWDQLAEDSLAATVIADGFHLPPSVLKVFEKVKGDNMIVISDSVALAGL
ncbi:N-acetylglucosamine-6-phosphate deacetylase, partial [Alcanivoracaceae bacterium MT1]